MSTVRPVDGTPAPEVHPIGNSSVRTLSPLQVATNDVAGGIGLGEGKVGANTDGKLEGVAVSEDAPQVADVVNEVVDELGFLCQRNNTSAVNEVNEGNKFDPFKSLLSLMGRAIEKTEEKILDIFKLSTGQLVFLSLETKMVFAGPDVKFQNISDYDKKQICHKLGVNEFPIKDAYNLDDHQWDEVIKEAEKGFKPYLVIKNEEAKNGEVDKAANNQRNVFRKELLEIDRMKKELENIVAKKSNPEISSLIAELDELAAEMKYIKKSAEKKEEILEEKIKNCLKRYDDIKTREKELVLKTVEETLADRP